MSMVMMAAGAPGADARSPLWLRGGYRLLFGCGALWAVIVVILWVGALGGRWTVYAEDAVLAQAGGRIAFRFRGRDLHLVLGPGADGKPVRLRVRIDGKPPAADHGMDIDADGNGTVDTQRLYQLVRQAHGTGERLFEVEFLDPGVHAYAFTFG